MRIPHVLPLLLISVLMTFGACSTQISVSPNDAEATAPDLPTTDPGPGDVGATDVGSTDAGTSTTPTGSLAINEVVTSPVDGGTDWIELVVIGSDPVSLSAYTLVDDNEDHSPATLPDVTLQPGEFYVIKALSSDSESTEPFVPFKLGSSDGLWLARDGATVDSVSWPKDSAPEGASYGRLPDGTGAFATLKPTPGAPNEALSEGDLPCTDPFVTDRVIKIEIELSAGAWQSIQDDPEAEEFHEATFVYDGERVENVGVRTKGNSSLNSVSKSASVRFPFKVYFNRYVDGLSFCGLKKLAFNNGFKDPSFIREHLAYRLAREIGLPASRTAFVDLTVGGTHLGLYTMVEPVDDDFFLEANFGNDNGDLYKPDMPDGNLVYQGDSIGDYGGLSIENNEETTDHSAFLKLVDVMNHGPSSQYTDVIDVDGMLKYIALNTLLVNLDSYTGNGHNYYIYEQDGAFTIIPWDLNEAFGNFNCGCDRDGVIGFLMDEPTCGPLSQRPLAAALLAVPEYKAKYHAYLEEYLAGPFSEATMSAWIQEAADLIRPYVQADPTKFFSYDQFEQALVGDVQGGGPSSAIGLEAFVSDRGANLSQQLSGGVQADNGGAGNCGGGNKPGDDKPPGGNGPKCPDGICDAFEQANPDACPQDCQ